MKKFLKIIYEHRFKAACIIITVLSLGIGIIYLEYEEIIQMMKDIPKRELIGFIICLPG